MQVSSSKTIMPPEPMIAPALVRASYSVGVLRCSAGRHPPEGPPIWTALNFLCSGIPPPMSNTIRPSGVPMSTSTSPTLQTLPVSAKTLVPLDESVPTLAYSSPPRSRIKPTLA